MRRPAPAAAARWGRGPSQREASPVRPALASASDTAPVRPARCAAAPRPAAGIRPPASSDRNSGSPPVLPRAAPPVSPSAAARRAVHPSRYDPNICGECDFLVESE